MLDPRTVDNIDLDLNDDRLEVELQPRYSNNGQFQVLYVHLNGATILRILVDQPVELSGQVGYLVNL